MPRVINKTLRQFSTGTIKIDLIDSDILRLQESLDRTADTVLIGMIIAGVIIGSSLVLTVADVRIPQFVFYLAALAYVIAIVIGLYALYHLMFGLKKRKGNF